MGIQTARYRTGDLLLWHDFSVTLLVLQETPMNPSLESRYELLDVTSGTRYIASESKVDSVTTFLSPKNAR